MIGNPSYDGMRHLVIMVLMMIMPTMRVVLANPSYGAVRLKLWPQWRNLRTTFGRFIIMMIIIIIMIL